ncbi:MAG: hypothetical protein GY835_11600 [bacterium]|nr:hypothetical protein [bacterium]
MAQSKVLKLFVVLAVITATTGSIKAEEHDQTSGPQHWHQRHILGAIGLVEAIGADDRWRPHGTGVFIDVDSTLPSIFFVTNRHILLSRDSLRVSYKRYIERDSLVIVRTNYAVFHKGRKDWTIYPDSADLDFAAFVVNRESAAGVQTVGEDELASWDELRYGEEVVFYGYPAYKRFGLDVSAFKFPVARRGAIAYFAQDDILFKGDRIMTEKMFLVDGVSIGGGSGSPLFIQRQYITADLKIANDERLAGIVFGHYPFEKQMTIPITAIPLISAEIDSLSNHSDSLFVSRFLKDISFTYDENSDLAMVISCDLIIDFIKSVYSKR